MTVQSGRIPILGVTPLVECGRWPIKAVVDETFTVSATVFREGHDAVNANVVLRGPRGRKGPWTPMHQTVPGTDRWEAEVTATAEGDWTYVVEAWGDPIAGWRHDAEIKVHAGIDVELMLEEGARLLERAAEGVPKGTPRRRVTDAAVALRDIRRPVEARLAPALAADVRAVLDAYPLRELVTQSPAHTLRVERERALSGAWYELFPRSEGAELANDSRKHSRSGTFKTAAERLDAVAAMGFDVVYLPPIHPIGQSFRKGPNNTLEPTADDPGVPWAIGSEEGGHDAIHPDLGTVEDFDDFVARANELNLEVALDFALQASPDHPWVTEHPEWFSVRADGSIAYAENPPKKYQDIYPLNFDRDPEGIYQEIKRVLRYWMDHGVRIFRVDNPHTKPVQFWERLLADIRRADPDVIFLAEAFTRPAMMHALAMVGFQQSYTYFTWRNDKWDLEAYFQELSQVTAHFFRPNCFVNTPDILHAYLQYGGRPAFKIRAALAATLSPTWGMYAGYELYEHVAVRPGSEEYLDSEKYQYRPRDWAFAEQRGDSLAGWVTQLNDFKRQHPALNRMRNLRFHWADDDHITVYSKARVLPDGRRDTVLMVVNLDPHAIRETTVHLDMQALGLSESDSFNVRDEMTGEEYRWGAHNYVRLDPYIEPAHLLTVHW
jgi:starch synthase (maltosyl-transferring)